MSLQVGQLNQKYFNFSAANAEQKNNINSTNLQLLKKDTVTFKGIEKMSKYAALPVEEKRKIMGAMNHILHKAPEMLITIIGHKPSSLTNRLNQSQLEILIKHKELFESKNIKIREHHGSIEVFHIPKLTETVENNIGIYRDSLGMENAHNFQIVNTLVNTDALDKAHDHVLYGLTYGYPKGDAILHQFACDTIDLLYTFTADGKYPIHEKVLAKVVSLLTPDMAKKLGKFGRRFKEGTQGYYECKPFVGLKPIIDPDMPLSKSSNSAACYFATYDPEHPEVQKIEETTRQGVAKAKELFKKPKDILNYLLSKD